MEKVVTFLDKNRTWFSWGTMMTLLGAAIWLIQSMNGLSNTINIINVNLENFTDRYSERADYVNGTLADFEIRLRNLEKKTEI